MRNKIQEEAVEAALKDKKGLIVLPPGMGKTKVGIDIAKHFKKVLVAVPKTPLKDQWRDEFRNWNVEIEDLRIECFKTAYKITEEFDLVIIDEAHLSKGQEYKKMYDIPAEYMIGLTGTKIKGSDDHIIYEKTIREGIEANAIEKSSIYNLSVPIKGIAKAKYNAFDSNFKKATIELSKFNKELNMNSIFEIAQKYSKELSKIENLNKYAKMYWSAMTMRKWMVYNNPEKIRVILNILEKSSGGKWIIFNKSIKFAEELHSKIENSLIYHSKMKSDEREKVLEKYKEIKDGVLIAVDALSEGLNVPSTNRAISAAGTSVENTFHQQNGRISRKKDNSDPIIFINLYTEGTVEENWVREKTNNIDRLYINKINQINEL